MKLAIRGTLFFASLGLILAALVALDLALTSRLEEDLVARFRQDLTERADLVAERAGVHPASLDDRVSWDALANVLGLRANARVTLVRRDGVVLGDSELDAEGLKSLENHRDRPEVKAALETGHGVAERRSTTLHERMLYVAAPFVRSGEVAGVVRVALPLRTIDEEVGHVHRTLLLATLVALAVAVVLSSLAAEWASRSLRPLTGAARRMGAGDLSTRVRPTGNDEFAALGNALDQLAESLSVTVGELRSERDLLGRVLDGMAEGVLVVDGEGRVALVNPALREMLLLGADAVGRAPIEVIRHPELQGLLERAIGAETAVSGELDLAGLKPRKLLVRVLPLSGDPAARLAVFVDVTDLRRLESLRRDFVANVSHELRTPVTAIRSASETLKDAVARDPEAVPMFLDIIERNAERLHRLVEDLLDLSRIDAREYRLNPEPVDLAAIVSQSFTLFRDRAEKKRIRLVSEVPANLHAKADRRALEQVLSNLLENAIKYCPENAEVRVRAAREGERFVRLAVQDTGPGIEAKHLARVFERFYRVDKGRSRDVGGTGLGLSIVKNLVEAMNGTVGVESTPGHGSTFSVALPTA